MKILSTDEVLHRLSDKSVGKGQDYLAMYSSWYGGIIQDPALMLLPIDDHMVHRGDGVFEAFRSFSGRILEVEAHFDRLEASAKAIELALPMDRHQMHHLCLELLTLAPKAIDVLFRLYISRGPGSFTANPYESVGSQLYIVMSVFRSYPSHFYQRGARAGISSIPVKATPFSQIKSCNYLPNVLMKKEAIDRGLDFTLGFTSEGDLAEGSTENILLVTPHREVLAPLFDYTLRGTTLLRVMDLFGQAKQRDLGLVRVDFTRLNRGHVGQASEIMMVGTTIGVLPGTEWEGRAVGSGSPGPFFEYIHQALESYQLSLLEGE
ncbi:MAG: aminotransferase class IV [Bdellovibrionales bacterium]|nr:aminotransferase class IV [Bdellovibrionales bacterium]